MTTMKSNLTKSLFCLAIASSSNKACEPYASSRCSYSYSSSRKDQQKAKREKIIKPFSLIKVEFCKRYPAVSAKAEQVVKVMEEYNNFLVQNEYWWTDIAETRKQQIVEEVKAGKKEDLADGFVAYDLKCLYSTSFRYKLVLYQLILALFQEISVTFHTQPDTVTAVENIVRIVKECIKVAEKNEQKFIPHSPTAPLEYEQMKRDIAAMISNKELEKLDEKEKEFWKWVVVVFERIKNASNDTDTQEIAKKIEQVFRANA